MNCSNIAEINYVAVIYNSIAEILPSQSDQYVYIFNLPYEIFKNFKISYSMYM